MSDLIGAVLGLVAACMGILLIPQAMTIHDQLGLLIGGLGVVVGLVVAAFYLVSYSANRHIAK